MADEQLEWLRLAQTARTGSNPPLLKSRFSTRAITILWAERGAPPLRKPRTQALFRSREFRDPIQSVCCATLCRDPKLPSPRINAIRIASAPPTNTHASYYKQLAHSDGPGSS